MDMAETQNEAQLGLECWMNGDPDASAAHLVNAAAGLAAAGKLKDDTAAADLTDYLRTPVVNIFACMNNLIDTAVRHWAERRG